MSSVIEGEGVVKERKIDALIHEKVMNLPIEGETRDDPFWVDGLKVRFLPKKYSTDISAAWQIVERLRSDYDVDMSSSPHIYEFRFLRHDIEYGTREAVELQVSASLLPMAICLAALKAFGVEVPE